MRHPANPLPVDGRRVWTFGNLTASLYWDEDARRYRGWYRRHVPGTREDSRFQPVESADGLAWHDVGPDAGEGGPRTIWFDADDPDPRRRFKHVQMAFYRPEPEGAFTPITISEGRKRNVARLPVLRRMVAATSPDGMHWSEPSVIATARLNRGHPNWIPGEPDWEGGDSIPCVLLAPELGARGKYVVFFRTNIYNGPGQRRERGVSRSESEDFKQWSPHELVLQPQVPWHTALGYPSHDYYQLPVWRQAGIYLGIVSVFYWGEDRNHLELAWSPDTIHWERVCPGTDLVPHGELGEYDGGCRYAAMRPITVGDEVRVYYGGSNGRHNADHSGDSALCLATFWRDRFAGYAASGAVTGTILTRPFQVQEDRLSLNVDAFGGEVRAELCDEGGTPLPGYGRDDAAPITTDSLDAGLEWDSVGRGAVDGLSALRGRTMRLRFYANQATVFAFGA